MQAGLCRMRTESLVAPSPPAGKRFLDARDERPQTAPASNAARTAWNAGSHPHRASALHPVQETAIIPVCSGLIRGIPANLGSLVVLTSPDNQREELMKANYRMTVVALAGVALGALVLMVSGIATALAQDTVRV